MAELKQIAATMTSVFYKYELGGVHIYVDELGAKRLDAILKDTEVSKIPVFQGGLHNDLQQAKPMPYTVLTTERFEKIIKAMFEGIPCSDDDNDKKTGV